MESPFLNFLLDLNQSRLSVAFEYNPGIACLIYGIPDFINDYIFLSLTQRRPFLPHRPEHDAHARVPRKRRRADRRGA